MDARWIFFGFPIDVHLFSFFLCLIDFRCKFDRCRCSLDVGCSVDPRWIFHRCAFDFR